MNSHASVYILLEYSFNNNQYSYLLYLSNLFLNSVQLPQHPVTLSPTS